MKRADTLPLRTFNGTEIKVSTPRGAEQTGPQSGQISSFFSAGSRLRFPETLNYV
jgi:hypothetical protein